MFVVSPGVDFAANQSWLFWSLHGACGSSCVGVLATCNSVYECIGNCCVAFVFVLYLGADFADGRSWLPWSVLTLSFWQCEALERMSGRGCVEWKRVVWVHTNTNFF